MTIRPAVRRDLEICRRLDGSCVSESVWNMQQVNERDRVSISFSPVRLPRPVEVAYPVVLDDLVQRFERGDCILVAEDDDIVGWLAMSLDAACNVGWVGHLMVIPERRRQGIGTALLREAVRQAREGGLRAVLLACQAKNGPAVAFCHRLGLEFCGYNEHHYADHGIALLFAYKTR